MSLYIKNFRQHRLMTFLGVLLFFSACSTLPKTAALLENISVSVPDGNRYHIRSLEMIQLEGKLVLHGRVNSLLQRHGPRSYDHHLDVVALDFDGNVIETTYARLPVKVGIFNHELGAAIDTVSSVEITYHKLRGGHI